MSQELRKYHPSSRRLSPNKEYDTKSNSSMSYSQIINGESLANGERLNLSMIEPSTQSLSRKNSQTSISSVSMVQNQNYHTMQKQHQSIVRGYEIKMKNIAEQYRRMKKQMEAKIKELFHEKNHWQNMAMKLFQQKNIHESEQIFKQQNSQTHNFLALENEFSRQKQVIVKMQKQRGIYMQEKQQLTKQLDFICTQNNNLKAKCAENSKEIYKLKNQIAQVRSQLKTALTSKSSQKNSVIQNRKNESSPSKKVSQNIIQPIPFNQFNIQQQLDICKQRKEIYKKMIRTLNEQLIIAKMSKLNEKYQRTGGISSYNSSSSSLLKGGITYPVNIVGSTLASNRYRNP